MRQKQETKQKKISEEIIEHIKNEPGAGLKALDSALPSSFRSSEQERIPDKESTQRLLQDKLSSMGVDMEASDVLAAKRQFRGNLNRRAVARTERELSAQVDAFLEQLPSKIEHAIESMETTVLDERMPVVESNIRIHPKTFKYREYEYRDVALKLILMPIALPANYIFFRRGLPLKEPRYETMNSKAMERLNAALEGSGLSIEGIDTGDYVALQLTFDGLFTGR